MLAEKLAACATLNPGATSLYYWEGKLEQEYEVQMILKTTVSHQQALLECLKSHHPYQTPELLVLPVTTRRHRLPLMAQRIFTLILLLCSTSVFAGLFDAPGRSQFVPADQAFYF
ncbi:divalent-cation tolerance protein CutA [Shigella boydii]|uniref:Divalent-cation tolerance protein CutA n=1 Tax=Shigella boydii TaxID=621 RepID=A0A2X2K9U6_SHIBO|nr:divalent-cation tolerance protein CutA [Shigella boydii]